MVPSREVLHPLTTAEEYLLQMFAWLVPAFPPFSSLCSTPRMKCWDGEQLSSAAALALTAQER